MRLLSIALLTICAAHAQIYNLQTIAGGGLPENTPCTAADLGGLVEGLAVDGAGNLFIPVSQYNAVVRCDATTGTLTRVAGTGIPGFSNGQNVPATSVRLTSPVAVAVDAAGNLYIDQTGRERKVSSGIITTVAGNGIAGFSGDGGLAPDAEDSQVALAVDPAGSVYISDGVGYRIRKISNGVITTVAGVGEGVAGAAGEGVAAVTAQIGAPSGIAVDSAGTLYLAVGNGGVRKVSNGVIATVTGAVRAVGVAVDPSGNLYIMSTGGAYRVSAGALTPIQPVDDTLTGAAIAVDAAGYVYFPDAYSDAYDSISLDFRVRIRKVSNGAITTIAGGGYKTSENGPLAAAQLGVPTGVAVDLTGDLYFAESNGNRIRKLSNGVLTTVAGNGALGFAGDGGPATAAQLAGPTGIAFDSQGALYIADTYNHRVRKVANGIIATVAGNGTKGDTGDGGPALAATLFRPAAVAVDAAGTLYITDQGNRVRKVSNGVITAAACDGTYGYVGDNVPALSAQCKYPGALAVDAAGNLYFADTGNGYVREVTPDGIIHNVGGIGKQLGDGIPAVNALVSPNSLTVDAAGSLYIGDNGAIRRVTSGMIDTVAGGGFLPTGDDFVSRSAALGIHSRHRGGTQRAKILFFRFRSPDRSRGGSAIRHARIDLVHSQRRQQSAVLDRARRNHCHHRFGFRTGRPDPQPEQRRSYSRRRLRHPSRRIPRANQRCARAYDLRLRAAGRCRGAIRRRCHRSALTERSDRHLPGRHLGYGEDRRRAMAAWTHFYGGCQRGWPPIRRESGRRHQQRRSSGRARQRDFPLRDRRGRHNAGRNRWQTRLRAPADPNDEIHRDDRRPDGHSRLRRRRARRNRRPNANQRADPREPCPGKRRGRYRAVARLRQQPGGCHDRCRKLTPGIAAAFGSRCRSPAPFT